MIILIVVALFGPISLIIGLVDTSKDAGTFLTIGLIITGIEVLIALICLINHWKHKNDPKTQPVQTQTNRYAGMSPTQMVGEVTKLCSTPTKPEKPASVVKRGVAGTIIGGVPGAIIGAASAIDKNNRNKK